MAVPRSTLSNLQKLAQPRTACEKYMSSIHTE